MRERFSGLWRQKCNSLGWTASAAFIKKTITAHQMVMQSLWQSMVVFLSGRDGETGQYWGKDECSWIQSSLKSRFRTSLWMSLGSPDSNPRRTFGKTPEDGNSHTLPIRSESSWDNLPGWMGEPAQIQVCKACLRLTQEGSKLQLLPKVFLFLMNLSKQLKRVFCLGYCV